ncbi:FAD-dependent oxidoreductase [Amycolatopsis sp. EV170708-02-1]|uniref:FAD-dependent oxidoreductase n=1 Tax=Amycolatopsis sp. EV170708-02-1 TaxID=2919322 RepID=UPI0028F3FA79|nr:FAD-dependent oxidoreductase [Amycolatopsis sp. EV170708-02-1]
MRKVLISGAGIAGTTLAYWLRRHGFAPTVVERAPRPGSAGTRSTSAVRRSASSTGWGCSIGSGSYGRTCAGCRS